MSSSNSKAERLRIALHSMTERLIKLTHQVQIEYFERSGYGFTVFAPNFYWEEPTVKARSLQIDIKREYEQWLEIVKVVFAKAPNDVLDQLNSADKQFRMWLELESNWSLTPDPNKNEQILQKDISEFDKLIQILEASASNEIIVIPDTNSIVAESDPCSYRSLLNATSFTFLLLPTVLGELDNLKNNHRNPDFREKVKKSISRIKGWRKQGSLINGVTVDKSIIVRATASEPNMKSTLSWLDPEVGDDRLIANVLEIEAISPSAEVVLVTGDINLQNKADVAMIKTFDNPNA